MTKRSTIVGGLLAAATLLVLSAPVAFAAEFRGGDQAEVPAGEVVTDDLYVAGGTVTIAGTIEGDLVAAGGTVTVSGTVTDNVVVTGGTVTVSGTVEGDVIAFGGTVTVSGAVKGDVRASGGSVIISGEVREDVLAGGGSLEARASSVIGGDVVVGGETVKLAGRVDGDVLGAASDLRIQGPVGGKVEVTVERISLGTGAQVSGDVTYTSRRAIDIASGAAVGGETVQRFPERRILFFSGRDSAFLAGLERVFSQVRWFVATAVLGVFLLWLFPSITLATSEALRASPWRSLGLGLGGLILYPIAAAIVGVFALFVTGGAGLPIFIVPFLPWLAALLLSWALVSIALGVLVLERVGSGSVRSGYALLVGAALLAVVDLIPIVGGIIRFLVVIGGMGALTLVAYRLYRRGRVAAAP